MQTCILLFLLFLGARLIKIRLLAVVLEVVRLVFFFLFFFFSVFLIHLLIVTLLDSSTNQPSSPPAWLNKQSKCSVIPYSVFFSDFRTIFYLEILQFVGIVIVLLVSCRRDL